MRLVDTSVWIDHLRKRNATLVELLIEDQVLIHPFVIGELACGSIARRAEVLGLLATLPVAKMPSHEEVMGLVLEKRLYGQGIGWMDAHLLAATILSGATLWTLDKSLAKVVMRLNAAPPA